MSSDSRYLWQHKDLLDTNQLTSTDVFHLLDLAASFRDIRSRTVRKIPTLKGRTVILFFVENSTRTKTSFDVAAKKLSADTHALSLAGSSLNKGESLLDTALTLQAMQPDVIVVRHSSSGAAHFLSKYLSCGVVNAGDGWHAHPTQALLDCFALRQIWHKEFQGRTLLILGDIAHSRVARSNVVLFTKLGVQVRLCGPRTLLPPGLSTWPVTVYTDLREAIRDVDAVMCLRLQLERQEAGLLPSLSEYSRRFCLGPEHLALAKENARILHPGPLNRGLEISDLVADGPASLVLDQVTAGVFVRMAVLYLVGTRK